MLETKLKNLQSFLFLQAETKDLLFTLLTSLLKDKDPNELLHEFSEDNKKVKVEFQKFAEKALSYLQKDHGQLHNDLIQLTGSRIFDLARPQSDIDFAIISSNEKLFDDFLVFLKDNFNRNTTPKKIKTPSGLLLGILDSAELSPSILKDRHFLLEVTFRSPEQHKAIQKYTTAFVYNLSKHDLGNIFVLCKWALEENKNANKHNFKFKKAYLDFVVSYKKCLNKLQYSDSFQAKLLTNLRTKVYSDLAISFFKTELANKQETVNTLLKQDTSSVDSYEFKR